MAGVTVSPARSPAPARIRQADPIRDLAVVRDPWNDYLVWVNAGLEEHCGFSFDIEEILERNVADLAPFQPPHGRLRAGSPG